MMQLPRPFSTGMTICPGLQTGDEKQINKLDRAVIQSDANRPAGRRDRQQLGVIHRKRPPVRQVIIEGLEKSRLVHSAQLIDGHARILLSTHPPNNKAANLSAAAL